MKKIFLSLGLILIVTTITFAYDIVPKISVDLPSTFRTDYEVKVSMTIGAEARFQLSDYFSVGGGLEFLIPRTTSAKEFPIAHSVPLEYEKGYYTNKDFYFLPAYATILLYPLGNFGEYKPYLKLDCGYNLLFGIDDAKDNTGGLYIGGAIGFELFEKFILEVSTARYEAKDNDMNITYKKIGFKFGYKFTI